MRLQKQGEEKSWLNFYPGKVLTAPHPTDNKILTLGDFLEKSDLASPDGGRKLNALYRKALNSLVAFAGDVSAQPMEQLPQLLYGWIASLRVRDIALKTLSDYLMSVSGIYSQAVKRGLLLPTDIFTTLRAKLKSHQPDSWQAGVHIADFERFRALVKSELTNNDSHDTAADILILALLSGGTPLAEVAKWRKDAIPANIPAPVVIDRALQRSGREYLFPLKHGKRTPKQLACDVNELVMSYLQRHGIATFGDADTTLLSYWGYAALRAGVSLSSLHASLPAIPAGLPFLTLAEGSFATPEASADIKSQVIPMFVGAPLRWYAMHLRTRVTYDDLVRRFAAEKNLRMPETFYPTEEVRKHIGSRVVFDDQPFIHNVVFFKCRYDEIAPMFCRIGDVAWCYKTSMSPGAPYAAIHQRSFDAFQQAIGQFTPDFVAANHLSGAIAKGDEVKIMGGFCQGQIGTITDIQQAGPEGVLTYFIEICNTFAKSFVAKVDSRQVERLTTAKA